jgi:glyoxylase-like metal-dependent hydrolase (beta-lactamase superfamily II)
MAGDEEVGMAGQVVRVHERIWQIQAPFGGDGLVMLYLVRGEKLALVDTGICTSPIDDVRPALKTLGLDLADVSYILNTHGHLDHAGGNYSFKQQSPATLIHLHADDQRFAESHEYHRTFMTEFFHQFGRGDLAPTREAYVLKMIGEGDAGVDRLLADGDRLDLGAGLELTALHTPGHTPGSVCFYWEAEKLLMTGDAVQARGSRGGGWPLYFHASSYRRSLDRLREVPIETLCPGHGFHSTLPLNTPHKRGPEVGKMLAESVTLYEAIDRAVRARIAADPGASNLEVAQCVVLDLLDVLPALVDPQLRVPGNGGPTLWAHINEARA